VCPGVVFAQGDSYVPLAGIPGVDSNNLTLVSYLNALYILSISIGALFGVIKLAYAGVKYAMSDIVTDKESAKKDIYGVLFGLAILLTTYVVLYTINPNLTNLNILQNATPPSQPTQSLTEEQIREQLRERNPVVGSTFTGTFGSSEHLSFVRQCIDTGGVVVLKEGSTDTAECRT